MYVWIGRVRIGMHAASTLEYLMERVPDSKIFSIRERGVACVGIVRVWVTVGRVMRA